MSSPLPVRVEPVSVSVRTRPLSLRHWIFTGIALAGFFVLFLLLSWSVPRYPLTPAIVSLLSESVFDEDIHTYSRLLDPGFSEAEVIVLGSSSVQQALWSSKELTGKYLSVNAGGGRIEKVASAGQTFLDALFYLSEASLRRGQMVILHVAPSTFARGLDNERLVRGVYLQPALGMAFSYGDEIEELAALLEPRRRLKAGVISSRQLLRRMVANLPGNLVRSRVYGLPLHFTVGQREDDARVTGKEGVPDAIAATRLQVSAMLEKGFHANLDYNVRVLEVLLDLAEKRGLKVVLMETALMANDKTGHLEPFWPAYRKAVASAADRHRVPYVDLNQEVSLGYEDFLDARHTNSSGRRKWSQEFIRWLAEGM